MKGGKRGGKERPTNYSNYVGQPVSSSGGFQSVQCRLKNNNSHSSSSKFTTQVH